MQSYGWNLQRLQHSRNAVIDNGVCRKELVALEGVRIVFVDEVFAIEKPGSQLNVYKLASSGTAPVDQQPLSQSHCIALEPDLQTVLRRHQIISSLS